MASVAGKASPPRFFRLPIFLLSGGGIAVATLLGTQNRIL